MRRPKTRQEYIELVEQALFEVDDLRAAAEWDDDEENALLSLASTLASHLIHLREQLVNHTDRSGNGEELPLLAVARHHAQQIPFKGLLDTISQTYRLGLDA